LVEVVRLDDSRKKPEKKSIDQLASRMMLGRKDNWVYAVDWKEVFPLGLAVVTGHLGRSDY
jgi:hypothetical protein